jgi:hypothetical protein
MVPDTREKEMGRRSNDGASGGQAESREVLQHLVAEVPSEGFFDSFAKGGPRVSEFSFRFLATEVILEMTSCEEFSRNPRATSQSRSDSLRNRGHKLHTRQRHLKQGLDASDDLSDR